MIKGEKFVLDPFEAKENAKETRLKTVDDRSKKSENTLFNFMKI